MAKLHTTPSASHGKPPREAVAELPFIELEGGCFVLYPFSYGGKSSKPQGRLKRAKFIEALQRANTGLATVFTSVLGGRLYESLAAKSQTSEADDTHATDEATLLLVQQLQSLLLKSENTVLASIADLENWGVLTDAKWAPCKSIGDLATVRNIESALLLEQEMLGGVPAGSGTFERRVRTSDHVSAPTDARTQQMIDAAPVRQLDPRREAMRKATVEAVLTNAEWMSAAQVSDSINPRAKNKHAIASRLLKDQRVFALVHQGEYVFPRYAFDAAGQPLPVIRDVLQTFEGYAPFRVAVWFESTSSALDGKRPREVLETMAPAVLAAAEVHARGPMHG